MSKRNFFKNKYIYPRKFKRFNQIILLTSCLILIMIYFMVGALNDPVKYTAEDYDRCISHYSEEAKIEARLEREKLPLQIDQVNEKIVRLTGILKKEPHREEIKVQIDALNKKLKNLENSHKKYIIKEFKTDSALVWSSFIFIAVLTLVIGSRWIINSGLRNKMFPVYFSIKKYIFVISLLALLDTSLKVIAECLTFSEGMINQGSWLSWKSYCISPFQWLISQFSNIVYAVTGAVTTVTAYIIAGKKFTTRNIQFDSADGKCGLRKQLFFLEFWAIISLVSSLLKFAIFFTTFFLKEQNNVSSIYYLEWIGFLIPIIWINVYLISRIYRIRGLYYKALKLNGYTWQDISDGDIPPDPTIGFLGKEWWRMPAALSSSIAVSWYFLEASGFVAVVKKIIK